MAKQTVTLRLDESDLDFLASLSIAGASSLSEKVRALLAEARLRREGVGDAGAAWDYSRRLFAGPERAVRLAELACGQRSELVARGLSALPELTAFFLALGDEPTPGGERVFLGRAERGLADRLFALTGATLRLAQAGFPGCVDPKALALIASQCRGSAMPMNQTNRDTPSIDPRKEPDHE